MDKIWWLNDFKMEAEFVLRKCCDTGSPWSLAVFWQATHVRNTELLLKGHPKRSFRYGNSEAVLGLQEVSPTICKDSSANEKTWSDQQLIIPPWADHHVPQLPWTMELVFHHTWMVHSPCWHGLKLSGVWWIISCQTMNHRHPDEKKMCFFEFLCSTGRKSGAQLPQFWRRGPEVPWSWCHGSMMGRWPFGRRPFMS